jgi:hypothetical protein
MKKARNTPFVIDLYLKETLTVLVFVEGFLKALYLQLHRQIQNLISIKIYRVNQAFHISGYITKIILAEDLSSQKWKPQNQSYITSKHKKSCFTNSGQGGRFFTLTPLRYSPPSFMPLVVCFQERNRDKRGD